MALPSTRMEYRITLSHVDRGIDVTQPVIAALHPSETAEHLTLRVLAWCLLHQEGITFAPGLSDPEAADLWAHDLTGRVVLWVECGAADPEKLRQVVQHNPGAAVHAVFAGDRRLRELQDAVAGWTRSARALDQVALWTVPPDLVAALSAPEGRRRRWTVTVVGDHLYVDEDGVTHDGPIGRSRIAPEA